MIAAVSFDATCTVWRRDEDEWDILATLEGHENEVKGCAWNPSGTLLATCGRDKTVWIWEVDDGFELLTVLHGHSGDVKAVTFKDPEGDLLASASYDDTVKLWIEDGDDWICVATLEGHSSTVWDCQFLPDANGLMVTCGGDRSVVVWQQQGRDTSSWTILARIDDAHAQPIYSVDVVASDENGRYLLATASGDNTVGLFSFDGRAIVETPSSFVAHNSDVNCVRFNPKDRQIVATAADDSSVKIWRLD